MYIDIIIPFKNSITYLPKICENLEYQTTSLFKVYFISDNSNDGSIEYLANSSFNFNYTILTSDGDGPGSARNFGMINSTSEYICFIDSDDLISSDYVESFYKIASSSQPDIIECMYKSISPEGVVISGSNTESYISSKDRFIGLLDGSVPRLSWGKAFCRTHLKNNKATFPDAIHNGEDHIFLINAYKNNPKVELIYKSLYYWIRHDNSLTNQCPSEKTVNDFISVSEEKTEIFRKEKLKNNQLESMTLTFSRRIFKEARILQQKIRSESNKKNELINIMRTKINNSKKLKDINIIIQNDNTSYWSDVM